METLQQLLLPLLPGADLVLLAFFALIADSVVGGRKYIGRVPGPDHIFHSLLNILCNFLDHYKYAPFRRFLRGSLVFITGVIVLTPFGLWVEDIIRSSMLGHALGVLVFMLIFGQKMVRDHARDLVELIQDPAHSEDGSRFGAARWGVERQILRLSDGMVANGFVLFISGLTGLLIYRFLVMMMAVGSPKGVARPDSPFYIIPTLVYEIVTVLPALFSLFLTTVAALVSKVAQMHVWKSLFYEIDGSLFARSLPLVSVSHALGFQLIMGAKTKNGKSSLTAEDLKVTLDFCRTMWITEMISLAAVLAILNQHLLGRYF